MSIDTILKTRRLPTMGEVLVEKGEKVSPDTLVAKGTVQNPEIHELKLCSLLKVGPDMIKNYLVKNEGDTVERDEVVAVSRSFFRRQTRVARSPVEGVIERISTVSGRMILRGTPINLEVSAYVPGVVREVITGEGAIIETKGVRVEGMFGVGGETSGEIVLGVDTPDAILTHREILPEYKDKVILGGALTTLEALREAVRVGAKGVIVGGVDEKDLTYFLGYEIGVPVTGNEKLGLTLILTGGFGDIPMEPNVFKLLASNEGKLACINGATHIRSRSLRPDIILPSF